MAIQDPAVREIWILYSIGMAIALFRLYSRTSLLGFRGLQLDDYFSVVACLFWSAMVACDTTIRLQSPNVSPLVMKSLGYATATAQPLNRTELLTQVTQDKIDLLQDIMKLNLASWMLKPPLLWSLKGCMCVFFLRLTNNLPWMRKLTVFTYVACILTFIATELTLLLQCVPPKNHWDIFAYNWRNCSNSFSTRTQIVNYLVVGLTNIITDILLIIIPIPMLWQVRIPRMRKIATGFLLCSGVFIVVINIVRTTYGILSYKSSGERSMYLRKVSFGWGMRENFTAVVIVNAVAIRPFFSSAPWKELYSKITGSKLSTTSKSSGTGDISNNTVGSMGRRKASKDPWATETKMEEMGIRVETTLTQREDGEKDDFGGFEEDRRRQRSEDDNV